MIKGNILAVSFCFIAYITYSQNKINKLSDSFEEENFITNWGGIEKCCAYSIQRSDSVAKSGNYSLRFELRKDDSLVANGKRAEIKLKAEASPNVERWYRFSYFLPDNYKNDSIPEILAQWHEIPDWDLGEDWRSPPLSLFTQNGQWKFLIMWATDKVNTNKTISGRKMIDLGEYETGRWTEWIFHLYFAYKEDGLVQIWKNGELVVDYHGPNYYNDKSGPYFKVGIYKWDWKNPSKESTVTQRVFFIDDVRVGDDTFDFNKISGKF